MASRYWVGGTGTWNASNTTNWSATSGTSGGTGGASVPTTADDVIFDAGSGSGTCSLSTASVSCKSINFTNTSVAVDCLSTNYPIIVTGGNITLGSSSSALTSAWVRLAPTTAISVTISGVANIGRVDLVASSAGATAALGSNIYATTTFNIYTSSAFGAAGTNSLANYNVEVGSQGFTIGTGAVSTVNLGTGTITSAGGITFPSDATSVTCSNTKLIGTGSTCSIYLYSRTVSSISSVNTSLLLRTAGTAGSMSMSLTSLSRAVSFYDNFTITGLFSMSDSSSGTLTCNSNPAGTQRTITAGSVSLTNVTFQDINAAGAAIPWSGTGLINGGNNTNINFVVANTKSLFFGSNF